MLKLIAHRGYKNNYKENTINAFKDALKNDFEGFECDLRTTKDKRLVIYHNPLYEGKLFKLINFKDLNNINTLEEVLNIDTNKIILIDIKDPFIDTIVLNDILNNSKRNIYVMSFYDNVIKKLYKVKKNYKIGVLNYVINTKKSHFDYDFIGILDSFVNEDIINNCIQNNIELFIYGIYSENFIYKYPYYIID